MSLLSPLEKEIAEVFKGKLLKTYVTAKLDDEEDEPELPEKEEEQTDDEWRLLAIRAMDEHTLKDPIFNITTKEKQEKAEALGGKVLVEGATYYVFPGEMSAETASEFAKDFGRRLSPKSVNNSIRHLFKKKHDEAAEDFARRVAAQVSQSNRGGGGQRGNNRGRGRGRGGNWGRTSWQSNGGQYGGWRQGVHPGGSWRPSF
jgi:hypothetical protein